MRWGGWVYIHTLVCLPISDLGHKRADRGHQTTLTRGGRAAAVAAAFAFAAVQDCLFCFGFCCIYDGWCKRHTQRRVRVYAYVRPC
jgi:hypothetical protein